MMIRPYLRTGSVVLMLLVVSACSDTGSVTTAASTTSDVTTTQPVVVSTIAAAAPSTMPESDISSIEDVFRPEILRELTPLLTRIGVGLPGVEVEALYEPYFIFPLSGREPPAAAGPVASFVVFENLHEGELAIEPLGALFAIDDGPLMDPESFDVLTDDGHHRSTRFLFSLGADIDAAGLVDPSPRSIKIVLVEDGVISEENTFLWLLPLELPAHVVQQVTDLAAVQE